MSCFVPLITQKLALLQQQQQTTQSPAPARGLLSYFCAGLPQNKHVQKHLRGSNSPTMHVQMNCLTHKLPRKSFPVINWLEKAGWILDGRSAHCYCTGSSHQVPDMENLKLIKKEKKKETSKTFLDKHTGTKRRCVHSKGEKWKPCCCVLIEAGLGCLLRVIGTLKELFFFASSDGPEQWLCFVGEAPNSAFLPAPLTAHGVEQSSKFCSFL